METQTQRKLVKSGGGVRDRSYKMKLAVQGFKGGRAYLGRVTFFDGSSLTFNNLRYIGERDKTSKEIPNHGYYTDGGTQVHLRDVENIYLTDSIGIESRLSLTGRA
ncbi:hypothetical protein J4205_03915 [Candidatus Pacearchaeota archaeon]|nr:hypothetical protein [uncultured archaeon]MBS3066948.1 hypothetical protein [Candidatus Pacearchaeota archaeon]